MTQAAATIPSPTILSCEVEVGERWGGPVRATCEPFRLSNATPAETSGRGKRLPAPTPLV
jgi:hypothetical protein